MSRAPRKAPARVAAPPATPRLPEAPPPAWARGHLYQRFAYPHTASVGKLARIGTSEGAGPLLLPRYQRAPTWAPERQVAFCRTVWEGRPCAPLLFWRRYVTEGATSPTNGQAAGRTAGYTTYVIDGQQRLLALGVNVLRADGTPNPPASAYFDLDTGEWGTEPGPRRGTMAELLRYAPIRADTDWPLAMLQAYFADRVGGVQLVTYTIETSNVADVIEAFRSINRPGVPLSEEDVEALLREAGEDP